MQLFLNILVQNKKIYHYLGGKTKHNQIPNLES